MSEAEYYISKEFDSLSGKTAMEIMDEYTIKIAETLKAIAPEAKGFRIIHVFTDEGSRTKFDVIKKDYSDEIEKQFNDEAKKLKRA